MERERERRLSEAALNGSVDTLNALIKEDPLILDRASTTWFDETPLHIAVLRGHIDFSKALLSEKPKFSTEVDLQGRLPLHLASVEGYVEIVGELLRVNPDTCLVRDHDENIPLHLAVMKGRIEVIKELIQARPNSIMEKLDRGETVLHLAVKHNHLEALKLLVKEATKTGFVNSIDENGNTALHVAAMHKRKEVWNDQNIFLWWWVLMGSFAIIEVYRLGSWIKVKVQGQQASPSIQSPVISA